MSDRLFGADLASAAASTASSTSSSLSSVLSTASESTTSSALPSPSISAISSFISSLPPSTTLPSPYSPLVLLTGGTGHVGFTTLLHLLAHPRGYRVRAAVRSSAKASFVLSRGEIQGLPLAARSRLTFCVVEDITAPRAYDAACAGCDLVVHVASPLVTADKVPTERQDEHFVRPAVRGTLNVLEAAERAGTVRRVVVTSSVVALLPVDVMEGREAQPEDEAAIGPRNRVEVPPGPPFAGEFVSYAASKTAALLAAEAWVSRRRPPFDVVHLHPSFVQGRNPLATTPAECLRGTNAVVLATLLGKRWDRGFAGAAVHVDDVAACHVAALDPLRVPGNRSYVLDSPVVWDDAADVVRRHFPDAVDRRLLHPSRGSCPTIPVRFDAGETEKVFGIRFRSFDEQVRSVVGQFLDLKAAARSATVGTTTAAAAARKNSLQQVAANA